MRVCVVNDREDGAALPASQLEWRLVDKTRKILTSGAVTLPAVSHGGRQWVEPGIDLPPTTPSGGRIDAKLLLTLKTAGAILSTNEYKILLASPGWCKPPANKRIVLVDKGNIRPVFDSLHIRYTPAASVKEAANDPADVYVLNALDTSEVGEVQALMSKGGKILLLDHDGSISPLLFPEYIKGALKATEGDISNMDIPESPVFDGLAPLDLRYFNNDKREVPTVCRVALKARQDDNVDLLAKHVRIHGYLNGNMEERARKMETIQGETIIKVHDKAGGTTLLSTLLLEKGTTDPVAGKLLVNMLEELMH